MTDDFIPRGLATCEHGCCPPEVCTWVGDCDRHDIPLTEEQVAEMYQGAS